MSTVVRNKFDVLGRLTSGNVCDFFDYASPVAEYTNSSISDASLSAGCLAPNGKIYFIPGSNSGSTKVLVIDPIAGTTERLDCGSWSGYGAVAAHDGFIYCFPYGSVSTIMSINPETHEVNTSHKTGVGGSSDYLGATLHPNGNIYLIPSGAQNVGVYTPSTNTFSSTTTGLTGLPSGAAKWYGGCLAQNGKIYCAPYNHNSVLIIDVDTPSTDITTIASMSTYAASSWRQGCLAPNGKIYFSPRNGTSVLIVDPSDDSKDESTIASLTGSNKYCQGILAPNGKIYCLPMLFTNALVIDPGDDSTDTTTYTGYQASQYKFYGRVLGPNGKIYAPAFDITYSLFLTELVPGGIDTLALEGLLSPYVNNC